MRDGGQDRAVSSYGKSSLDFSFIFKTLVNIHYLTYTGFSLEDNNLSQHELTLASRILFQFDETTTCIYLPPFWDPIKGKGQEKNL